MGILEQIEQKSFLGAEFLTWLWFKSEGQDGKVDLKGDDPVEVEFQDTMTLEALFGEATMQTLRGDAPGASAESRQALLQGKKVKRAKIHLTQGEIEWTFSLRGDTLDFSAIRIPAPKGLPFEEGASLRLQAAERLFALIDNLYAAFLAIRLDPEAWPDELTEIRRWVEEK